MEIRVLTSSSVHSRGLDDFIVSQMICGKCNNRLRFGRTGGQSCESLEEKIGGEVTTAGNGIEALSEQFLHPFHGGLLSVLDLDPVGSAMNKRGRKQKDRPKAVSLCRRRCTAVAVIDQVHEHGHAGFLSLSERLERRAADLYGAP